MHVQEKKVSVTVRETAKAAAETMNVDEDSVLVASTGVIGMQLPIEKLCSRCQSNGSEASGNSGSRK